MPCGSRRAGLRSYGLRPSSTAAAPSAIASSGLAPAMSWLCGAPTSPSPPPSPELVPERGAVEVEVEADVVPDPVLVMCVTVAGLSGVVGTGGV